jgi:hypothetical protein
MLLCFELRRSVVLLSSERWILQDKVLGSRLLNLGIVLWRNYSLFDQSSCCGSAWHSFPIFPPSSPHEFLRAAGRPGLDTKARERFLMYGSLWTNSWVFDLRYWLITRNAYDSLNTLAEDVDTVYESSSYTVIFIIILHFVECCQRRTISCTAS